MQLAPNPRYSGVVAKALGGSFKSVTLTPNIYQKVQMNTQSTNLGYKKKHSAQPGCINWS